MAITNENPLKPFRTRYNALKEELSKTWLPHYREVNSFISPVRGKYLYSETTEKDNDGSRNDGAIYNSTASLALRVLAAGMMGGLTSPARPWFGLETSDRDLNEYEPVKLYLSQVSDGMLSLYARSNCYLALHSFYEEMGAYGTGAFHMDEDFEQGILFKPYTVGEYMLAAGENYQPNTLYRRFSLTTLQIIDTFARRADNSIDWTNVSERTKRFYETGALDRRVMIVNGIQPSYDGGKYDSIYWELEVGGGDDGKILSRQTYFGKPFVASRWDVVGTDVYGRSPGMMALGDTKMLQKEEEKKLKALDKSIDPPMNAPTSMESRGVDLRPGGINYVDTQTGNQGLTPTFSVNPNIAGMREEILGVEQRIKDVFYYDMFISLANVTKRMTATEVAQRYEEKLLVLGTVIERLEYETFNPMIQRTFDIMYRMNLLPPAPAELQGQNVRVKYLGLLSQAQKMVGATSSVEQLVSFAGQVTALDAGVLDNIDFDEAVRHYGSSVGVPPKVMRPKDQVDKMRSDKAAAMQQQQQLANAAQMAQSAKVLADSPMNTGSALDAVMGGMNG